MDHMFLYFVPEFSLFSVFLTSCNVSGPSVHWFFLSFFFPADFSGKHRRWLVITRTPHNAPVHLLATWHQWQLLPFQRFHNQLPSEVHFQVFFPPNKRMSIVVQESICILFTPSVFKASRNSEGLGFYLPLLHNGPKIIQQPYFLTYKDDGIARSRMQIRWPAVRVDAWNI